MRRDCSALGSIHKGPGSRLRGSSSAHPALTGRKVGGAGHPDGEGCPEEPEAQGRDDAAQHRADQLGPKHGARRGQGEVTAEARGRSGGKEVSRVGRTMAWGGGHTGQLLGGPRQEANEVRGVGPEALPQRLSRRSKQTEAGLWAREAAAGCHAVGYPPGPEVLHEVAG